MPNYRISFNGVSEGLRKYDENNSTLFDFSNPYGGLAFAMALHGEVLKDWTTSVMRTGDSKHTIAYVIGTKAEIPENVKRIAEMYLNIEPVSDE